MFQTNDCPHDLRNPRILAFNHKSTTKSGINTIAFRGPQIWQNIPLEIRNLESLSLSKFNMKQIQSIPCVRKICRSFKANLRYIDWFFFPRTKIPFAGYETQSWKRYMRQTLVSLWNSAIRKNFNFIFFFSSFLLGSKNFWVWRKDWALGYNSMKFWDFPNLS